jgi:hypothetical protein
VEHALSADSVRRARDRAAAVQSEPARHVASLAREQINLTSGYVRTEEAEPAPGWHGLIVHGTGISADGM